jgi:hypothetical protein
MGYDEGRMVMLGMTRHGYDAGRMVMLSSNKKLPGSWVWLETALSFWGTHAIEMKGLILFGVGWIVMGMTWNCLVLLGHTCYGNEVINPFLGWFNCHGYDLKLPCPFGANIQLKWRTDPFLGWSSCRGYDLKLPRPFKAHMLWKWSNQSFFGLVQLSWVWLETALSFWGKHTIEMKDWSFFGLVKLSWVWLETASSF